MTMTKFEAHFHQMMLNIYHKAADECNYRPSYFLQMVTMQGGLDAAKYLLASDEYASGLTKLWNFGRLDLSMEALIIKREWRQMFTEKEIDIAKKRLKQLGYEG